MKRLDGIISGPSDMSDDEPEAADVVRMGDTLANSEEYAEADEWIGSVINQFDLSRAYSTREFLHLMGRELAEIAHEDGIMTAAFKSRIPVFCPDLVGTELSIGIARARFEKKSQFTFDMTQDTMDMMQIAQKTRNSGIITLGSTSSQNMVNMAEISSYITRTTPPAINTPSLSLRILCRSTPARPHSLAIIQPFLANFFAGRRRRMFPATRRSAFRW